MISRYYLFGNKNEVTRHPAVGAPGQEPAHGSIRGWAIVILFSGSYLTWIIYHRYYPPSWLSRLPEILLEAISLAEMAAALSLIFLWTMFLWRYFIRRRRDATSPLLSKEQLLDLAPTLFESFVADLFRRKGFQVIIRGGSGDHGVDLELKASGGKRAIVQCKRYRDTVGEQVVRDLFGTLLHERASRAFLITTGNISDAAYDWARGKPITLIDGDTLVKIASVLNND